MMDGSPAVIEWLVEKREEALVGWYGNAVGTTAEQLASYAKWVEVSGQLLEARRSAKRSMR